MTGDRSWLIELIEEEVIKRVEEEAFQRFQRHASVRLMTAGKDNELMISVLLEPEADDWNCFDRKLSDFFENTAYPWFTKEEEAAGKDDGSNREDRASLAHHLRALADRLEALNATVSPDDTVAT